MQPISRRDAIIALSATAAGASFPLHLVAQPAQMQSWPLAAPQRTGIHDVAPSPRRARAAASPTTWIIARMSLPSTSTPGIP